MSKADALSSVIESVTKQLVGPDVGRAYLDAIREIGAGTNLHTGKPTNPALTEEDVSRAFALRLQSDAAVHLPNVQIRMRWLSEGDWSVQRNILLAGGWSPEEAEYIIAGLKKAAATIDATAEEIAA